MLAQGSEKVRNGAQDGGEAPPVRPLDRSEIVTLMREIERIQARFALRNNTGWVRACDTILGNCRKLLEDGQP